MKVGTIRLAVLALTVGALPMAAPAPAQDGAGRKVLRFIVAPQGNEARYRVREQLMGVDFPNDAIGKTSNVEGGIVITADGTIVQNESRFAIDLASLKSDKDMRDNFLRRRTLQTDEYATAVFIPAEVRNLKFPLPASGDLKFQLAGALTVRGVTRPVTWNVEGRIANGALTGEAETKFTFAHFELEKPRVRSVLSVEDEIKLEYTFFLVPAS